MRRLPGIGRKQQSGISKTKAFRAVFSVASVMAEEPVPLTDKDLSSISGPKSDEIAAKGDSGAEFTGTSSEV